MTIETDVSRKMTTTKKPNRADNYLFDPEDEKLTGLAPSTEAYVLLKKLTGDRDRLTIELRRTEKELGDVTEAIDTIVKEIQRNGIRDANYVVTGVTLDKKRHVDAQWFLEHEPSTFERIAKVDGKVALRILSNYVNGDNAVQPFLRKIGGEVFTANAKITMADLQKTVGNDGLEAYERLGGVKAVWSPVGEAYLMPIHDAKLLGRKSILELEEGEPA